jgi:predicted nucleic acid-binding protein
LGDRREKIKDLLSLAQEYVRYSRQIENKAKQIERWGFMAMDALHIACAEAAKSDFFVTCDAQLVRKGEMNAGKLQVKIISLMEFVLKEVLRT